MKYFCLCLALLLSNNLINAQDTQDIIAQDSPGMSNFNFNFEASTLIFAGSASINIEGRIFSSDSERIHFYARAGYGKAYQDLSFITILVACPEVSQSGSGGLLGITMLTGGGNHHFEVNASTFLGSFKTEISPGIFGQSCEGFDDEWTSPLPVVDLGYRYQKPGQGFIFRAKIGNFGLGIGLGVAF